MTETENNINNQKLCDKFLMHLEYTKWIIGATGSEVKELDHYIQEKTKDLVQKFQTIAEKTLEQDQKSLSAKKDNEKKITISGKTFTYTAATIELKRLTDALIADSVLTYERTLLRKKVEDMLRALFSHAETSKDFTEQTKESAHIIKKSIVDIIMAFQFQDFAKQRMQHIEIALSTLLQETDMLMQENGSDEPVVIPEEKAKALINKFTLSKVQEKYLIELNSHGGNHLEMHIENDDEDDIELF